MWNPNPSAQARGASLYPLSYPPSPQNIHSWGINLSTVRRPINWWGKMSAGSTGGGFQEMARAVVSPHWPALTSFTLDSSLPDVDKISGILGWPYTCIVAEDGFELLIPLPLHLECWGCRHPSPHPVLYCARTRSRGSVCAVKACCWLSYITQLTETQRMTTIQ